MAIHKGIIQLLAKSSSEWLAADPVLQLGRIGAGDVGSSTPILKIGDGVRAWSVLPNLVGIGGGGGGSDYVAGTTVTLPPGSAATVAIDNTVDPPTISFGIPRGDVGAAGPANSLSIGTVTTGAPGSAAGATITGTPPAQTLSLTIPAGAPGGAGPPNSLEIGTVTTGAPGSAAAASITGTPPAQVLNLTIPQGPAGTSPALGNPSATVALAAKNGVATTAMRSDGAPALDVTIAPTWSATHTFGAGINLVSGSPIVLYWETGAPGNGRVWRAYAYGGKYVIDAMNDAQNTATVALSISRSAHNVTALEFGNATSNPTYAFLGTGALATGGHITAGGDMNAIGGRFLLGNWHSVTNLGDGWLRLNDLGQYANGVLVPGLLRANQVRADGGLGNSDLTKQLNWNFTSFPFGTAYLTGKNGGFDGLVIYDGLNNVTLMGNGAGTCGVYVQGDSQWLLYRNLGSTAAATQYNLSAPSFNSTSSRAIKRETGTPSRAADLLARLRPILYRLLADDTREQLGLIAEEVAEVCPQLSDGNTVSYDRLALLLLADWQHERGLAQ